MGGRGVGPIRLLGRASDFRLLVAATLGSGLGTYFAALALTIDIYDRTRSGTWVGALLIVEFLPIVLIGLTLGPLVDRVSRRSLMIWSDLVRIGVFCALPFVNEPAAIVALAGVAGVASGFFRPAVAAGLPNLVTDEELPAANSLLQTVENLAWMAGPVAAGALVSLSGPHLAYWVNAATFLVSALLVARIPAHRLRSEESLSRGHWQDVGEGLSVVRRTPALLTVLVVWSLVMVGNAAFNVAEVVFAKESLDGGDFGFGVLVGATGLGLTLGGYYAARLIERFGISNVYVTAIVLWSLAVAGAAASPWLALAAAFVVVATVGNGVAVVANILLVQRAAPDRVRGRVFTVIMSVNYLLLGLAMAVAGPLTNALGGRWMWGIAAGVYAAAALLALAFTRVYALSPAEEAAASRV